MLYKTFVVASFLVLGSRSDCLGWSENPHKFGEGCPDNFMVQFRGGLQENCGDPLRDTVTKEDECSNDKCCKQDCYLAHDLKKFECPSGTALDRLSYFQLKDYENATKLQSLCCVESCRISNNKATCPDGKVLSYGSCDEKYPCSDPDHCCVKEGDCIDQICGPVIEECTHPEGIVACHVECPMLEFVPGTPVSDDADLWYKRLYEWGVDYGDSDNWDECVECLQTAGTGEGATKQLEVDVANGCLNCLFCKAEMYGEDGDHKQDPPAPDTDDIEDPRPLEKTFTTCMCPEDFPKCFLKELPGVADSIPTFDCWKNEEEFETDDGDKKKVTCGGGFCNADYGEEEVVAIKDATMTLTSPQAMTETQQADVTDSYCTVVRDAASNDKIQCNIEETSTRRRRLLAVSYLLSAWLPAKHPSSSLASVFSDPAALAATVTTKAKEVTGVTMTVESTPDAVTTAPAAASTSSAAPTGSKKASGSDEFSGAATVEVPAMVLVASAFATIFK